MVMKIKTLSKSKYVLLIFIHILTFSAFAELCPQALDTVRGFESKFLAQKQVLMQKVAT